MDDLYYQLKYASYQVNIGQGLKRFWQLGSRRENHKHDLKIFSDPDRNHRLKIFLASFSSVMILFLNGIGTEFGLSLITVTYRNRIELLFTL